MEHLFDRAVWFSLGVLVGLFMNTIVSLLRDIKEKVTEVDEIVKHDHDIPKKDESGFFRVSWNAFWLAVVVVLVAYSSVVSQIASNRVSDQVDNAKTEVHNQQVSRCQSGVENRNVQRALVEAIYGLATGSVSDQKSQFKNLTPEEVRQYNAYISRVNDFRAGMYDKIKPSEECAPFVDDDNVEPPSDPFPLVPNPTKEHK